LVTEHLGIKHLNAIIGISAGGMQTRLWSEMYPEFMDAIVPLAAEPAAMGRNWMMRRMLIDAIRNDPEWKGGNYERQPTAFRIAGVFFGTGTVGGALAMYNAFPTAEKADRELDRRVAHLADVDANDTLYALEASHDYDPSADIEKIRATVLAINSADDERNPPELGIMEAAMKRIRDGRYVLIPVGPETRGHGTKANAKLWKTFLGRLLAGR
jgi:homoserine O-acetyltransferase/O-succinyltransferase